MADLALTKIAETNNSITFSYPKVEGCEGYQYFKDGQPVSRTFDPNKLTIKFSKDAQVYRVVPLDVTARADGFVWPAPTPPQTVGTGLGYLRLGNSELPAVHANEYDLIALGLSGFPNNLTSKTILYASGTNVPDAAWDMGVPIAECRANGWILKDSAGQEIYNKGYSYSKLGDVGNSDYQRRWCEHTEETLRSAGADGFYADDTIGFGGMWWNTVPPKYPNRTAWDAAMVSFCKAIWDYFSPKGFYVSHNAGDYEEGNPETNNGMLKMRWWAKVGPYAHGLMAESWMFLKDWGHGVRIAGPGWNQQWDAIRAYHKFANGEPYPVTGGSVQLPRPIDFIGLDYGSSADEAAKRYCLTSFLLDYQRKGSVHVWHRTDSANPWSSINDQVIALGQPVGAPTRSGNVHSRSFQHGSITVDAGAGNATINVS